MQFFTAVGTPDGEPNPQNSTRWRVFCQRKTYNTSEGGPCTWRPTDYYRGNPSCFDGFDDKGNKVLNKERIDCKDAWIDENDIEHNPAYGPGTDEEINGHWVGEFSMIFEYGLYKKFNTSLPAYRPVGCPGLPENWDDLPHDNHGDAWKWTDIEKCPLNDFAPEGKALHAIVEEMADNHDVFGKNLLAAYERMIQNGYDANLELNDAPVNSWFGYYTMEGQDKFADALPMFEKFVEDNAPLAFTNPDVDPYTCGNFGANTFKCRFKFSEVAEMAKWQYASPLQFNP